MGRTLFQKVWDDHAVHRRDDGLTLLHIDRHLFHEGSFHAFNMLRARGLKVRRPDLTFGFGDHYAPTLRGEGGARSTAAIADPEIRGIIETFERNAADHGIRAFALADPDQGIVHVAGPELGLTLPGMTVVCGDSHTSTHGALGALAFGIGASEVAHVLATQTIWQSMPRQLRVTFGGSAGPDVSAKDLALALIARIGTGGAAGSAVEFAGEAVRALPIEGRLTLCNMAIEAGARTGMAAPDEVTRAWLRGRPFAPAEIPLDGLASDPDARFDAEVSLDAAAVQPMATWGTSPEEAAPLPGRVPRAEEAPDEARARAWRRSLDYMGLSGGERLADIRLDRVFLGSCTNARLDDLRAAAGVLRGRRVAVPMLVSPGSTAVKRAAEAEGLDRIFAEAGAEWRESGCSLCVAMNGDMLAEGERCASTSNRNFPGRQGRGARTHLVSPASAAASALAGRLVAAGG
jgi:3-isopropylmalate/(R)-2-methylmalate dehydratase large subunit